MRILALASLLLAAGASTGCAAILSGTRQHVQITSHVPETTCITLGGTVGTWVAGASTANDFAVKMFESIDPYLPEEARGKLRHVDLNELITICVLSALKVELPPALVKGRDYLQRLPPVLIEKFLEWFYIMDWGKAPRRPNLERGQPYTVIAWAPGRKARMEVIGVRPNWWTFLNVLNLGLGLLIDIPTGAWLKLEDPIRFRLEPLE